MRLCTLNGAPLSERLGFSEESLLLQPGEREPAFRAFLDAATMTRPWSEETAKWRHVPGNASDTPSYDDFVQHSLLFHSALLPSHLVVDASQSELDAASSSSFLPTSFDTATTSSSGQAAVLHLPPKLIITSLSHLPSVQHLKSIYPQTVTLTLLCVLTTPVVQRDVVIRKSGRHMHLCETTVADDTTTGFQVSFWCHSGQAQKLVQESLRNTLGEIRVGDILLLRNIVLSVFRDRVYGQSLAPAISKARTVVEILAKPDGSSGFTRVFPTAAGEKFIRVKSWARDHVVSEEISSRKRKGNDVCRDQAPNKMARNYDRDDGILPPDTLESC